MSSNLLKVASLSLLSLCCLSASTAADVRMGGTVTTGIMYTNPEHSAHSLVMTQWKQGPSDSNVWLRGREDLGNGWYAGFHIKGDFSLDSGKLAEDGKLFNGPTRIIIGKGDYEVSFGRIPNLSSANDSYSIFPKLRANQTGAGLNGIAPAPILFNPNITDNSIAFASTPRDGFFVEGIYSNGEASDEQNYDWSDNYHYAQFTTGYIGNRYRIGTILSWEMPDQTSRAEGSLDTPRKNHTYAIHLIGGYDFGNLSTTCLLYYGKDQWRMGPRTDMSSMIQGVGGSESNYSDSEKGMDTAMIHVSAAYPYGRHRFTAAAGYLKAKWKGTSTGMSTTQGSYWQAGAVYYYSFSKLTQVYAAASIADGNRLLDTVDRLNQKMAQVGFIKDF